MIENKHKRILGLCAKFKQEVHKIGLPCTEGLLIKVQVNE